MALLNSYFKAQLTKTDRMLEDMYNVPTPTSVVGEEILRDEKQRRDALKAGKYVRFLKDPLDYELFLVAIRRKSTKWSIRRKDRGLYVSQIHKKKGFYYTLTPQKKAVIFAANVKDPTAPLRIPTRLGMHRVVGVTDLMIENFILRYSGLYDEVEFADKTDGKKAILRGMLSFPNLLGHEALEATILRDGREEIEVAPTVKRLTMATLPNARVLRLPSTLNFLGPLHAPKLERIEVYDCRAPDGECTLHKGAFILCKKLTSLAFPYGVKALPDGLLYNAKELRHLTLHEGLEDIGRELLLSVTRLDTLQVDTPSLKGSTVCRAKKATIRVESYRSFYGEIESLAITGTPNELRAIPKVSELTLPDSIETICAEALKRQSGLRRLTLPSSLKSISSKAFERCGLTEVIIPDGVKYIASDAFIDCASLERVKWPAATEKVDSGTFEGCAALKELELSAGVTEIVCRTADSTKSFDQGKDRPRLVLPDLRPLGRKNAVDSLLRVDLIAKEGSPAAAASEAYRRKMNENIEQNVAHIKDFINANDIRAVEFENLDHITAAVRYLSAVDREKDLLLTLTKWLADFFEKLLKGTGEEEFIYVDYFHDTLRWLRIYRQNEARDILEPCKNSLLKRIAASTKHAFLGEEYFEKDTRESKEEALDELAKAYRIYPRNIPALLALIRLVASDTKLYDTELPDKLLELIEEYSGDGGYGRDYVSEAKELLESLRQKHKAAHFGQPTKEEKRDMYWADLNREFTRRSVQMPAPTKEYNSPSVISKEEARKSLLVHRCPTSSINASLFSKMRKKVEELSVSYFSTDVGIAEQLRREKLNAVDRAEASFDPKKRAALEADIQRRRNQNEKEMRKEEEERRKKLEEANALLARAFSPYSAPSSYSASSYSYSSSYSSSNDDAFFDQLISDYWLEQWARAEALDLEGMLLEHHYYESLGIFGDLSY